MIRHGCEGMLRIPDEPAPEEQEQWITILLAAKPDRDDYESFCERTLATYSTIGAVICGAARTSCSSPEPWR